MSFLLTIDLGGTRSRVGLTDLDSKDHGFVIEAVYQNDNFTGIDKVISLFYKEFEVSADYACLAVAGVVESPEKRRPGATPGGRAADYPAYRPQARLCPDPGDG